ncbi:MAG TPA: NAD(P)-dependent oxidoreductase [Mycobacterium sp.]|nr:NAD(P)-dependent oxidoreductase [Mycobacterium sp.]
MTVLVTGAFGLVGSATVRQIAGEGRRVVATDLDVPANRAAAETMSGVEVRYADLTDPAAIERLVAEVKPTAIVHLAAIIAPFCYSRRALARKVNVDGTANLLAAAAKLADRPRFVHASSIAVYGPRNPHTVTGVLRADTPTVPGDLYGSQKLAAEELVRASELDWAILRLGGVISVNLSLNQPEEMLYFESVLPTDGRLQTVDVRDVASAFSAATVRDGAVGKTLLIGGDDATHRQLQGEVAERVAGAMGMSGGFSAGRPGNPDSDLDWFATDWMDTAEAQQILEFQQHSWPEMMAQIRADTGAKRVLFKLAGPIARAVLSRRSAYHRWPGQYADPWTAIRARLGDPKPD